MKVKDLLAAIAEHALSLDDEVVVGNAMDAYHRPLIDMDWLNLEQHAFESSPPVGFLCLRFGDLVHNDPAARKT